MAKRTKVSLLDGILAVLCVALDAVDDAADYNLSGDDNPIVAKIYRRAGASWREILRQGSMMTHLRL